MIRSHILFAFVVVVAFVFFICLFLFSVGILFVSFCLSTKMWTRGERERERQRERETERETERERQRERQREEREREREEGARVR